MAEQLGPDQLAGWLRRHGLVPPACVRCGTTDGSHNFLCSHSGQPSSTVDAVGYWQAVADGAVERAWLLEDLEDRDGQGSPRRGGR